MYGLVNMFSDYTPPDWAVASFPYVRIVLLALIVLLSIGMIIVVLIQPSNQQGMGGLTGQSDTFYSRNKSKTSEGFLKRLTVIFGCSLFVLSILFFVSLIVYSGTIF